MSGASRRIIAACGFLAIMLTTQSCGADRVAMIAEKASDDLNHRIDLKAFDEIYALGSDTFQGHTSPREFAVFMQQFSEGVGNCRSATLQTRNVSMSSSVDLVQLIFRRDCDKRNVTELVVWEVVKGQCRFRAFNYSLLGPGD